MPPILQALIRLQNPFMKWLLRSRFHSLVSRFYMIIMITGRRSGQVYETPVQYLQEGTTLWVITSEQYRWWRNLRGGALVKIYLRGQTYEACATPFTDAGQVQTVFKRLYPTLDAQNTSGKVALAVELQHE